MNFNSKSVKLKKKKKREKSTVHLAGLPLGFSMKPQNIFKVYSFNSGGKIILVLIILATIA